ncbi:hypothetical protein L7F22_046494 [Adiantum nelumboides]|nr:hypothetical protein [Adiantum nelumboides]
MEALLYEDTKEVEANIALEDDLSAVIVKKKRRVSFAQTQTIHVIPRHDDIETPPLLNSDTLPSNANTFSPASRFSAESQSVNPRVSTSPHDHPLHDESLDFSHFTSDMDTGHGSWADDDSSALHDSADGLEDESGCFVHLRHISHLESDDSIVNEVLLDDMTMDATTFSRNLSHFLKFGTTCDLQEASHPGEVAKLMKDCDALSEEESMALTKTGAPHQGLINPQDVSIHGDDDKSDMSLATGSDRVRPKKRGNLSNAAKHSLEGFIGKSIDSSNKEKENFAPHNIQEGLSFSSPKLILNPQYDSELSRLLSNTMDISLPQSLPRKSAVLAKIDGNSQTPPISRRRSDITLQDASFSASDPNFTLPVRNLKDLLLDHTDYTITRKFCRDGEISNSKILSSHNLQSNGTGTESCSNYEHVNSQGSDLGGLHSLLDNREVVVDNWQNTNIEKGDQELAILNDVLNDVDRVELTDSRQNQSKEKVAVRSMLVSNLSSFHMTYAESHTEKKMTEDAATSVQGLKQLSTGLQQDPNARSPGQNYAKQLYDGSEENLIRDYANQLYDGSEVNLIRESSQISLLPAKEISFLSNNSLHTSTVLAEQSSSKNCESKRELTEVNKPVKGQELLDSSLQPLLAEPRSQNKRLRMLDDKTRIFLEESKTKASQISRDNVFEDRTPHQPLSIAKGDLSEKSRSATKSRMPAGVGPAECNSFHPSLRAPRFLEDILHRLKNTSYIKVNEAEEEYMVQPPPIKLQTLSDYLEFSCNTQPQVDWLNEHIQELEVKLLNAKKRKTEVMSCNASAQFQKLSVEPFYASRSKFASMHSLAKKGWILWKLDAQRQVLLLLQESKENLMKEVEDVKIIGQQVMDLKESYSQLAPKVEFDKARCEAIYTFAAAEGADQVFALHQVLNQGEEKARGSFSQSMDLKDRHHLYQLETTDAVFKCSFLSSTSRIIVPN